MKLNRVTSERLGESYYRAQMPNGLTVLVCPMPEKNGIFAMLSAGIGSVTRDFSLGGRAVAVPAGVAHFLEHKLFEGEGEDAFSLFAQTGASANAYTSFDKTSYLFQSSINTEESLRTLIRFVTRPHFTKELVYKEQGIIAQEIKMYDDNADWVLTTMMLKGLYQKHPVRDDIAGTVESIAQITPEILYDCYNAFYRPANMVLAVAGNIDPQAVAAICEEEYACVAAPAERVERRVAQEPGGIARASASRGMPVFETQFGLAYKEQPFKPERALRDGMVLRILLEMLAGETSALYRRLYDDGLVNDLFDASALAGEDYLCVAFSGESAHPDEVVAAIRQEIAALRGKPQDAAYFLECKRALMGAELCSLDNIESVATKMTSGYFKNYGLYDIIENIESIALSDVEDMLTHMLEEKNSTVALITPVPDEE